MWQYLLRNQNIPIHGKGDTLRSFVYMSDVSRALFKILLDKKNIGETFHISSKKFITILELTKLINRLMNVKHNNTYHINERDGKDLRYTLNSNKIRNYYSWSEKTSLNKGIIDTINWVKKNIKFFEKASLNYKHIK